MPARGLAGMAGRAQGLRGLRAFVLVFVGVAHLVVWFFSNWGPPKASTSGSALPPIEVTLLRAPANTVIKKALRRTQPSARPGDPANRPLDGAPAATPSADTVPSGTGHGAGLSLDLSLPPTSIHQAPLSAKQEALRDPRSNTPRPTLSEQFDITLGVMDCVFSERLTDGSIYRGPGRWEYVPDPNAFSGKSAKVCVKKPP